MMTKNDRDRLKVWGFLTIGFFFISCFVIGIGAGIVALLRKYEGQSIISVLVALLFVTGLVSWIIVCINEWRTKKDEHKED